VLAGRGLGQLRRAPPRAGRSRRAQRPQQRFLLPTVISQRTDHSAAIAYDRASSSLLVTPGPLVPYRSGHDHSIVDYPAGASVPAGPVLRARYRAPLIPVELAPISAPDRSSPCRSSRSAQPDRRPSPIRRTGKIASNLIAASRRPAPRRSRCRPQVGCAAGLPYSAGREMRMRSAKPLGRPHVAAMAQMAAASPARAAQAQERYLDDIG
jgi:hypothetical protein